MKSFRNKFSIVWQLQVEDDPYQKKSLIVWQEKYCLFFSSLSNLVSVVFPRGSKNTNIRRRTTLCYYNVKTSIIGLVGMFWFKPDSVGVGVGFDLDNLFLVWPLSIDRSAIIFIWTVSSVSHQSDVRWTKGWRQAMSAIVYLGWVRQGFKQKIKK